MLCLLIISVLQLLQLSIDSLWNHGFHHSNWFIVDYAHRLGWKLGLVPHHPLCLCLQNDEYDQILGYCNIAQQLELLWRMDVEVVENYQDRFQLLGQRRIVARWRRLRSGSNRNLWSCYRYAAARQKLRGAQSYQSLSICSSRLASYPLLRFPKWRYLLYN